MEQDNLNKNFENIHKFNHYTTNSKYLKIDGEKRKNIARHINNKLACMNYSEKMNIYKRLLDETKLNKKLLNFELENLVPDKINDFTDYISQVNKYLIRYTGKAGGYLFEDDDWNIHDNESKKYELSPNEIIFDNNINISHKTDLETFRFMKKIINLLNKCSTDYKASYKYMNDPKDNIIWIIIKLVNNTL
jgi:hypothetical protein